MKWVAISSRRSKKDFIDLYFICQSGISLDYLLHLMPKKFPGGELNLYHLYHVIIGLCYFEDAENEAMPQMFRDFNWDDIKEFFYHLKCYYLK